MNTDYAKLGFKCGVEIHQQLETHKLFCNCPSLVNDDSKPDVLVKRKLMASAGETGEIDLAAKHEISKGKYFLYEACSSSSCLVELDEEPPHELNKDALETALQIALMLNCKVVDQIQFMRKMVVDGSNTTGFQRTALIGFDGYVETPLGKVKVDNVCLEEEAAKKIEDTKEYTKFRLDRLGVALIEIGTDASIKGPEHAKEVAEKIGMILRSTGRVKRGLGTIRQDVNVSISKGARVEIKGFQDLRSIPKVINYEVERQLKLIEKGEKVNSEVRKAEADLTTSFMRPMPGASRMYPETDVQPVNISKEILGSIKKPELISEKAEKLEEKYGINADIAKEIAKEGVKLEDYISKFGKVEPKVIANILVEIPKEVKSRFKIDKGLTDDDFNEVLGYLNKGEITKEAVLEIFVEKLQKGKVDYNKFKSISDVEVLEELKKIRKDNKDAPINALMGEAMKKFRGKVEGKKILELLKRV
jgi:glutamyl-tRNA(Gln) amidotransferase subunit E